MPRDPVSSLNCIHVQGVDLLPAEVYPAGVELTSQGTLPSYVYFIENGCVKLVHTFPEGRQIIQDLKLPGDLVGASSVMLSEPCTAAAVTIARSGLVRWPPPRFLAEVSRNHSFSIFMNGVLSRETRRLCAHVAVLGHGCSRARLLQFLNEHSPSNQAPDRGRWARLPLPITQRELAQALALSEFHLSKVLSALEREGLIRRARGWIDVDRRAVVRALDAVRQRVAAGQAATSIGGADRYTYLRTPPSRVVR